MSSGAGQTSPAPQDRAPAVEMLRLVISGSVDDGKSTLIGRLLYESGKLFDDQLEALHADSKRIGTQGGELDFALLLDGLTAEREQGITIDVAYRYFSTEQRNFIVADTPGHEQYTRNLVTGASIRMMASWHVEAPVAMFRVYCSWPGVSAMINLRRSVEK